FTSFLGGSVINTRGANYIFHLIRFGMKLHLYNRICPAFTTWRPGDYHRQFMAKRDHFFGNALGVRKGFYVLYRTNDFYAIPVIPKTRRFPHERHRQMSVAKFNQQIFFVCKSLGIRSWYIVSDVEALLVAFVLNFPQGVRRRINLFSFALQLLQGVGV